MKTLKPALLTLGLLTAVTGIIYPLTISALAAVLFPNQAGGSLVYDHAGRPAGSALLAQEFKSPRYFWPRPSACNYNALPGGASNLGPTSAALRAAMDERAAQWRQSHALPAGAPVPQELLQTSGSGLDPHLSPEAVRFQLDRVCRARAFDAAQRVRLEALIDSLTERPLAGIFGAWRVNVLRLNMALDALN